MSEIYIVQGAAFHLDGLYAESLNSSGNEQNDSSEGDYLWTCPRTVQKGDLICFYLLAPVSAIVARARFTSQAFMMTDRTSDWFGKFMATYSDVKFFADRITLGELRDLFPEFFWTRRPQGAICVPDREGLRIKKPFLELIGKRKIVQDI